jgi:predicted transcriptional regulator of viral defense system
MLRRRMKAYTQAPMAHHVLMEALGEYRRPNDKISELIKSGELLALRRGLYVPGPEMDLPYPDLFVIANNLRGPSYISMESALSFWGLIPERTYEVSSVTLKTSKLYRTPIGRFSYQYVASPYYSFGLKSVQLKEQQTAIIASREKALCDKIILTTGVFLRSIRQTKDFLIEDLRIDEENLLNLDITVMKTWLDDTPKRSSIDMLIKTLESL